MTELIIINAMWCVTLILCVSKLCKVASGKEVIVDRGAIHVSVKGK